MSRERPAREPPSPAPSALTAVLDRLLDTMEAADRGPRQNALFALWLFARHCDAALVPASLSEHASAGRLDGLERRLSSLSLPAPLRRALPGSLRELRDADPLKVPIALQQLVAPVREAIGSSLGDAFAHAARRARQQARGHSGSSV
jgi:hypothetical protein